MYEIECPMCESTEFETGPDGMHSCYICNTSWGTGGRPPEPEPTKFVRDVHDKLRQYASPPAGDVREVSGSGEQR